MFPNISLEPSNQTSDRVNRNAQEGKGKVPTDVSFIWHNRQRLVTDYLNHLFCYFHQPLGSLYLDFIRRTWFLNYMCWLYFQAYNYSILSIWYFEYEQKCIQVSNPLLVYDTSCESGLGTKIKNTFVKKCVLLSVSLKRPAPPHFLALHALYFNTVTVLN